MSVCKWPKTAVELSKLLAPDVAGGVTHSRALGHHRQTVLVRFTQYPNNQLGAEPPLLHLRLSFKKKPASKALTGPKHTGQVIRELFGRL
jgi:hypothetical protein